MLETMDGSQPVTLLHGIQNGNYHSYRSRLQRLASVRRGGLKRHVWYTDLTEVDDDPNSDDNTDSFHYERQMQSTTCAGRLLGPHTPGLHSWT